MSQVTKPHRSTFIEQLASFELFFLALTFFLLNLAFPFLLFFIGITHLAISRVICTAMRTAKTSTCAY
ncbi:MAG TPA: hypothetical protein DDZ88_19010 [Verrucomicrobiales bacterium]|nr:hypothetical protein [Verrucomicrobiales bacterium]